MKSRIIYTNRESADYRRNFATITVISGSPQDTIVLDFYEEYMNTRLPSEIDLDSGERIYENEENVIIVVREKKSTIMMSRQAALELASNILDDYGDDNHSEEEGEDDE